MVERLHKAEIHCFNQDGRHILLDVRRSKVLDITPLERDILASSEGTPLEALCYELSKVQEYREIERALERLQELGIIASEPISPPAVGEVPPSTITDLELNIAQDCNLRCRYCIVEQGGFGAQRQQMSRGVGQQAVDFILQESGENEFCHLTFFGGEPMLNFGLIEDTVTYSQAQAARHDKRIAYLIATNGTLFNEDNIAFIKKNKIGIQLSLDGPPGTSLGRVLLALLLTEARVRPSLGSKSRPLPRHFQREPSYLPTFAHVSANCDFQDAGPCGIIRPANKPVVMY